ncbi:MULTISPECIES: ABC transporter permease [Microbacterium]|uniref:ABC transporter permease subunit n=1 Tax=Microbacterium galbinum TaxID=2851646 RepID=A0ABY4INB9_9MICO|nr:ABC transporter permease subunit [Microbacterium galbinum]MBQ3357372.1 ABC transporter permease subunit [Microbacterium sp.]MCK2029987.1 ABC transporter permease subunit [Microbacterium galbinum]UPL14267.1 ABC transporter permease subunit [Microbacterium galbinum]
MNWVVNNFGLILELTAVHLRQSIVPIVLGFVLSLPLGWVAWRYRLVRGPIIVLTGLLYTIPSLALLILLPATLGYSAISETNLVIALTIYAIAILVRAVSDGLDSVDDDVRQAATATGFAPFRRFWAVEFPLAGPVILAGLRVTAVSTISLATVGILIGVTNLGYLFTNGLERRIIAEVFAGVIAVVVIALVIDLILLLVGRALMPWTRAASKATASRAIAVGAPA